MRISDWSSDVCSSDLLADNYLGFGMRDRAEEIYRNLAATAPDAKRIGHANLQLAEFDYERGYNAEARATLYRMREKLPPELVPEWQELLGRVLMADGRYGEAAEAPLKDEGDKSEIGRATCRERRWQYG